MSHNSLQPQSHDVIQWNAKFQDSLARASSDGSLGELLTLLSTMFSCDRIYIFQKNQYGSYDCSEEWCAYNVPHKRDIMQNMSEELCHPYYTHYRNGAFLTFTDIENVKEEEPELYAMLKPQGIHSLFSGQLTFAGEDLGFFGIDNPDPANMPDIISCFSILRYFISGILYSRIGSIRKSLMQSRDLLTRAGSWHGLYAAMDRMDQSLSIGILCCNLIGLGNINLHRGRQIGDSLLMETARIMRSVFGPEHIYRIDGDDFLAVVSDISSSYFEEMSDQLKSLLLDSGIAVEYAAIWDPAWIGDADAMLNRVRSNLHPLTRYEDVLPASSDSVPARIVLPQKEAFRHRANVWLRMLSPENSRIAVIAIDFNHFTLFSHMEGPEAANSRLEGMSRRLAEYASSFHGIAGYMGEDQFALLLPVSDLTRDQLKEELLLIAGKTVRPVGFAPAFGIFVTGYSNESFSQLYDRALEALSRIRGRYDTIFSFFDPESYEQQRKVNLLLNDVRGALKRGEFTFYVQPRIDIASGRICSSEALLRWEKDGQVMPPSVFWKSFEDSGFAAAVDYYIWDQVFAWQYALVQKGLTPPPVSVRVSQVDFYFTDAAESFRFLLEDYPLDPGLIEIEISESTVIPERSLVTDFIAAVKALGFHMLPKEEIARGIETAEQADALVNTSFRTAQGSFYYRPMKPDVYEDLLSQTVSDGPAH